MKLTHTESKEE
jgi:GTPase